MRHGFVRKKKGGRDHRRIPHVLSPFPWPMEPAAQAEGEGKKRKKKRRGKKEKELFSYHHVIIYPLPRACVQEKKKKRSPSGKKGKRERGSHEGQPGSHPCVIGTAILRRRKGRRERGNPKKKKR